MRIPKLYKPVIKNKQVSYSETMFPNLYKKKNVVYDDFSKIYLTNIKQLKEETGEMTIQNTKENEKENNVLSKLKYLNSTLISKDLNENTNSTSQNIFARDTMKNRFMFSFKSNKSKRQTLFNKSSRYDSYSPRNQDNFTLNIGFDNSEKVKILANYIPNL